MFCRAADACARAHVLAATGVRRASEDDRIVRTVSRFYL